MFLLIITINSIQFIASETKSPQPLKTNIKELVFLPSVEEISRKSKPLIISATKEMMEYTLSEKAQKLKNMTHLI